MSRWLILGFACAGALACSHDATVTAGVRDTAALRRAVWPLVAPGTRLDSAQRRLEREGFGCRVAEMVPGALWQTACDKESGGRWAIVRRTFRVVAVSADTFGVRSASSNPHTVARVEVSTGLVGP